MNDKAHHLSPKYLIYLEGFFLALIIFFLLSSEIGYSLPNIFNLRDFLRVKEILSGHLLFYGPELSKSGNIPGPFYYYLLALPYKLGGFKACAYLLFAMSAGVLGLLWIYFESLNLKSFVFVLTLFLISPVRISTADLAWNPGFLPLFWVALIILIYEIIKQDKQDKPDNLWYIFCMVAALAVQIHMSSLFWFAAAIIFMYDKKGVFVKGLLIFLANFIPYFVWLFFFKTPEPVPALMTDQVDLSAFLPFLALPALSWLDIKTIVYTGFNFFHPFLIVLVFLSLGFRFFFAFSQKSLKVLKYDFYFMSAFSLVCLFILRVFLTRVNARYIVLPETIAIAYVCYAYNSLNTSRQRTIFNLGFLVAVFFNLDSSTYSLIQTKLMSRALHLPMLALLFVLACLISRRVKFIFSATALLFIFFTNIRHNHSVKKHIYLDVMDEISQKIYQETGWAPEVSAQRLFWVGVSPEVTMNYVYESVYERNIKKLSIKKNANIDGFLIINKYQKEEPPEDDDPFWKNWIRKSGLEIISESKIGAYTLLSYKITHDGLPLGFQNSGLPNSLSAHYLDQFKKEEIFKVPTFEGQGPPLSIVYSKNTGDLIFFSKETARFYSLGPNLIINKGVFRYSCDGEERVLHLPNLGTAIKSDFKVNIKKADSYLSKTLYSPLHYRSARCKRFQPIQFKAMRVQYYVWGQKYEPDRVDKQFSYLF